MSTLNQVENDLQSLIDENTTNVNVTYDYTYIDDREKSIVINDVSITYSHNYSLDFATRKMSFSLGVVSTSHEDLNNIIDELDAINGKSKGFIRGFLISTINYGDYEENYYSADVSCECEVYA